MSTSAGVLSLGLVAFATLFATSPAQAQGGNCLDCLINETTGRATCLYMQPSGATDCTQSVSTACNLTGTCGGGSSCFVAGAEISTPDGPVAIETISVGDVVLSRDRFGNTVEQKVTRTYRDLADSYLQINGALMVTEDHPFAVSGRWVKARHLELGDRLTLENGATTTVLSIQRMEKGVRVYNIEVDGTHTFFAEGVLVHNKNPDPHQG